MKAMVSELKKGLAIIWHLQKSHIMKDMAYPLPFLTKLATVCLVMLLNILFINVSFSYIHTLAGWNYYQVLAVVGCYMIIEGIIWVLFAQLSVINDHVYEGTLDGVLLKPIDSQFLVSFWQGDFEDLSRCIIGIILIFFAVKNSIGFQIVNVFLLPLLLMNGTIILYSFILAMRSISFWVIDGSGVWQIVQNVTQNSQFPTDIYYHKIVKNILTFIIPIAFIATVPARVLTNLIVDWKWVALSFLMMFIFFFGSRAFWKFSLKHYSSASS